jgi:uncharacterized membrane protein YkvA (DUF1232 family)
MLMRTLSVIPFAGQLLRLSWKLFWDRRVPFLLKVLPLAAVIYILSPIDPIPDFRLGLGQLDDIVVAGVLLLLFVLWSPRHLVSEHLRGPRAQRADDEKTVEGNYRYVDPE